MPRRGNKGQSTASGSGSSQGSKAEASLEETVLRKIYNLYKNPSAVSSACGDVGIEQMSQELGLNKLHPSKKITVMLIGNHSAGKSSFINWYCGSKLQKTGVAVESQGFTVITKGQRPDLVRGESCIEMKPYLSGIEKFDGVMQHLDVRVSTASGNEFPTVDFLDTPGLIDGEVRYPFDVNNVILWLAQHVDKILVFMDPVGQALCTRTMNVVRALDQAKFGGKTSFYITKADQVPNALDLQNVSVQTVANLSRHVSDQHGLSVPTIWIPDREGTVSSGGARPESNYLGHLVADIADSVKAKVQVNMSQLQTDCEAVMVKIDQESKLTSANNSKRRRWLFYTWFIYLFLCPIVVLFAFTDLATLYDKRFQFSQTVADAIQQVSVPMATYRSVAEAMGMDTLRRQVAALMLFLVLYIIQLILARRVKKLKCRTSAELRTFREHKQNLAVMLKKGKGIRTEYLQATQKAEEY